MSCALAPRASAPASRGEEGKEKPKQPGPARVQNDQRAVPEPQAEWLGASDRLRVRNGPLSTSLIFVGHNGQEPADRDGW